MPTLLSDLYPGLDNDISRYILIENPRTGYDVYYEPYDGVLVIDDGKGVYDRIVVYLLVNNVRVRSGDG
jgi:hypothetical protein